MGFEFIDNVDLDIELLDILSDLSATDGTEPETLFLKSQIAQTKTEVGIRLGSLRAQGALRQELRAGRRIVLITQQGVAHLAALKASQTDLNVAWVAEAQEKKAEFQMVAALPEESFRCMLTGDSRLIMESMVQGTQQRLELSPAQVEVLWAYLAHLYPDTVRLEDA